MKVYPEVSGERLNGWISRDVRHPPGAAPVDFHYHDVEEWLELLEGSITFFTARDQPYTLAAGQALNIQPGEVHRANIGPGGAMYRMWLPVDLRDDTFQHRLDEQDLALVRRNLELPEAENRWDARAPGSREFLDDFTSEALIFRNAKGRFLGKKAYLERPPATVARAPSDTVCILYKDADHVLLSTVVQAGDLYSNTRFFVRADGSWKCRVWMNFPEPASP
jgi:hypothetical protein